MTDMEEIISEIRSNREESKAQHEQLKSIVLELKEDLRGNKERNIEGMMTTQSRHDKELGEIRETIRPITWAKGHVIATVIIFIGFVDVIFELNSHGLIMTVINALKP